MQSPKVHLLYFRFKGKWILGVGKEFQIFLSSRFTTRDCKIIFLPATIYVPKSCDNKVALTRLDIPRPLCANFRTPIIITLQ